MPEPFLYDGLLGTVGAADAQWRQLFVWSGRSLGKTTFLMRLHESVGNAQFPVCLGASSQLIRGRSPSASDAILEWAERPHGLLLIDDLDLVPSEEVWTAVNALVDEEGDWRLIASFHNPDSIEKASQRDPGSRTLDLLRLDPWKGEWRNASREAIQRAAETNFGPSGEKQDAPDTDVIAFWQDTILDITGGHPALIGAACECFTRLVRSTADYSPPAERSLLQPPGERLEQWRNAIRVYLEDFLVDKDLPIFTHTLRAVQQKPQLFTRLVRLARDQVEIENPLVRKRLRDSGLVHSDHERGQLVVAGPLIRQWILHFAEDAPISPQGPEAGTLESVRIEVIGTSTYDGLLHYETQSGKTQDIPVSGGPWRVLRCLSEAKGKPVSLLRLAEDATLGTEDATRSAIQRLQQLLKANGLLNVADNVRGKGYRLGSSPILAMKK